MGVEIIDGVVHRVERARESDSNQGDREEEDNRVEEGEDHFHIHVVGGGIIKSRKVLVAAGAFRNDHALLPKKLKITPTKTQTVSFILTKDDAERLKGMPSIIMDTREFLVYILPPILYPDLTTRLKVGGAYLDCDGNVVGPNRELQWGKEVVDWYGSDGSYSWEEDMIKLMRSIMPSIEVMQDQTNNGSAFESNNPYLNEETNTTIISNTFATINTPTGQAYIGDVEKDWAVAIGAKGLAAKSSDELGRLAALCVLDHNVFEQEEICGNLCKDIFCPQYESVCTLYYKHGNTWNNFPLRIDSSNGNQMISIDSIEYGLDEKLREDIRQWANFWSHKEFDYYCPREKDEKEFIKKGEELRRHLQDQICYDNVRVCIEARPIRKVKLMNEYTEDWPLWWGLHNPSPKYISKKLRDRVEAWACFFNDNFHWDTGWRHYEQGQLHLREGQTLVELLNEELDADPSTDWFVFSDFWECQQST